MEYLAKKNGSSGISVKIVIFQFELLLNELKKNEAFENCQISTLMLDNESKTRKLAPVKRF